MKSTGSRCSFRCSSAAKIFHLILFGIILPAACIVIPVYAKYVLYADTVVAFGASDMRMMDGHVSTTWCQVRNEKEKQIFVMELIKTLRFMISEAKCSNEHFVWRLPDGWSASNEPQISEIGDDTRFRIGWRLEGILGLLFAKRIGSNRFILC